MNEKTTFMGFNSIQDLLSSTFGFNTWITNMVGGLILTITTFITGFIYDDPSAIYTLWVLMFADWITGIYKSILNKKFQSNRIFRMPVYFVITTFLIAISWNIAKSHILFSVVPSFILGGFYAVYLVSLIENLGEVNLLPKTMVIQLKKRFGFKAFLDKFDEK